MQFWRMFTKAALHKDEQMKLLRIASSDYLKDRAIEAIREGKIEFAFKCLTAYLEKYEPGNNKAKEGTGTTNPGRPES